MQTFIPRFFRAPASTCFIFGPRGTGKSTWLRQNLPDAHLIDLLDDEIFREYVAHPERIKQVVAAHPHIRVFIVDEIQKAPRMLDAIHSLCETRPDLQFILTGSSARKLRRGGVNLLGGRALLTRFHPFMAAELGERFSLEAALRDGLIPLVVFSKTPSKTMEAYIALYLKEEVKEEGLVRDVGAFARFLEAVSFSHGSVLNVSNIARECQVSRKIAANYLSILEDLLLGYQLPVFNKRARRATTTQPKFYLFDSGVYHHLRPRGPLDSTDEIGGIGLEGLVLQHLLAWCGYSDEAMRCYFWRSRGGAEVDFVIYGESRFYAVEVKNSRHLHPKQLRSLKTFLGDYPEATGYLLYQGKERLLIDGITCLPVEDFLRGLTPNHWPGES